MGTDTPEPSLPPDEPEWRPSAGQQLDRKSFSVQSMLKINWKCFNEDVLPNKYHKLTGNKDIFPPVPED